MRFPEFLFVVFLPWQTFTMFCTDFTVSPENPYVLLNNVVELNCTVNEKSGVNVSQLSWRVNNSVVRDDRVQIINQTTLQFKTNITRIDETGSYICLVQDSKYLCPVYLKVEYSSVPEVTNFSCIFIKADDISKDNLTCKWDFGKIEDEDDINVQINASSDRQIYNIACPKLINKRSCSWSRSDGYIASYYLWFRLTVRNTKLADERAVRTYNYTIPHWKIVKPLPTTSVTATSNQTCVSLQWEGIPPSVDTTSKVILTSEWNSKPEVFVLTETYLEVCGLYPGLLYNITVSLRRIRGKFYSEEKTLQVKTKPSLPAESPEVFPGAFSSDTKCESNGGRRMITLYLKGISRKSENGVLSHFEVHLFDQIRREIFSRNISIKNLIPQLNLTCTGSFVIEITVVNEVGSSPKAVLEILPYKDYPPPLATVVEQSKAGDIATVTVLDEYHKTNFVKYLIVWCLGRRANLQCQGEVRYKEFVNGTNVTEKTLGYPISETVIGVTRIQGSNGSGITWQTCRYTTDIEPSQPQEVNVVPDSQSNQIIIRWNPIPCKPSSHNAFIKFYRVIYCEHPGISECEGDSRQMVDLPATNSKSEYIIQNVKEKISYGIQVQALSDTREGEPSPMQRLRIDKNDSSLGIVIAVSLIGGIIVAVLVLICIWKYRRWNKEIPIDTILIEKNGVTGCRKVGVNYIDDEIYNTDVDEIEKKREMAQFLISNSNSNGLIQKETNPDTKQNYDDSYSQAFMMCDLDCNTTSTTEDVTSVTDRNQTFFKQTLESSPDTDNVEEDEESSRKCGPFGYSKVPTDDFAETDNVEDDEEFSRKCGHFGYNKVPTDDFLEGSTDIMDWVVQTNVVSSKNNKDDSVPDLDETFITKCEERGYKKAPEESVSSDETVKDIDETFVEKCEECGYKTAPVDSVSSDDSAIGTDETFVKKCKECGYEKAPVESISSDNSSNDIDETFLKKCEECGYKKVPV